MTGIKQMVEEEFSELKTGYELMIQDMRVLREFEHERVKDYFMHSSIPSKLAYKETFLFPLYPLLLFSYFSLFFCTSYTDCAAEITIVNGYASNSYFH